MSSSGPEATGALASSAEAAFAAAQAALATNATAQVPDGAVQQLLTAGIRLFARKIELERRYFSPLTSPDGATATDAAVLMTELMRAVDLNLFDLSMWAARPREGEDQNEPADARGR